MNNHSDSSATSVPNGTAADEPFAQRNKFDMKNIANTILKLQFVNNSSNDSPINHHRTGGSDMKKMAECKKQKNEALNQKYLVKYTQQTAKQKLTQVQRNSSLLRSFSMLFHASLQF
ncbi:unnamed protein product [Anisakis simplex]|uniref:Uncharacterized protein n=1 Tax=Anisakis simplex TaxID=6269 RepID=A0A0M3JIG8_ANISI|nr:unnamed protein product [Anisakis simplex]